MDENVKYAGFGMRMLASAIDTVASIVIMLPLAQVFYLIFGYNELQQLIATGQLSPSNVTVAQWHSFIIYQSTAFIWQNIILAAAVISFWVYKSATPGKLLLNMYIVDAQTLGQPTKRQLIIRYLGYFISFLPIALGFIWIYYDKRHQGWHDKMAGTVVVIKK